MVADIATAVADSDALCARCPLESFFTD